MKESSKEVLVIIGNGFDLALGLETSYKQFYLSKYWPFRKKISSVFYRTIYTTIVKFREENPLSVFLENKMCPNWYNLELLLSKFALETRPEDASYVEPDYKEFQLLKESLYQFIEDAENKYFSKAQPGDSIGARFLGAICHNHTPNIYTFNYTNLSEIARSFGINDLVCTHVHGSLEERNIILGIEDNSKVPNSYDFLKKVSDPLYKSNNLYYDLMQAKDVIIFGHSLGENDFHFFRQFFKIHSDENNSDISNRCNITIITRDSKSRMDILAKLRNMNGGRNNQLFAQNNLQFIRTEQDNPNSENEFEEWIDDFRLC